MRSAAVLSADHVDDVLEALGKQVRVVGPEDFLPDDPPKPAPPASPRQQLGLFSEPSCRHCGCTTARPCSDADRLQGDTCSVCRHGGRP